MARGLAEVDRDGMTADSESSDMEEGEEEQAPPTKQPFTDVCTLYACVIVAYSLSLISRPL